MQQTSAVLLPLNPAVKRETVCALDLGSKNFKFVSGYTNNGEIHTRLLNKITLNLGQEVDQNDGMIRPNKLSEVEAVLGGFVEYCRHKGISDLLAIATSAVNQTKNKVDILSIAERLGIKLEIADGRREGEVGYLAATLGRPNCLVTELGSHSCQITWDRGRSLRVNRIQAGYQHGYRNYFHGAEVFEKAQKMYRSFLDQQIGLLPLYNSEFIALAANSLAGFVTGKEKHEVAGSRIARGRFQDKLDELNRMSEIEFDELKHAYDKPEKILPGLVFIDYMMEKSGHDQVLIAEAELPVGLIVEHFKSKR